MKISSYMVKNHCNVILIECICNDDLEVFKKLVELGLFERIPFHTAFDMACGRNVSGVKSRKISLIMVYNHYVLILMSCIQESDVKRFKKLVRFGLFNHIHVNTIYTMVCGKNDMKVKSEKIALYMIDNHLVSSTANEDGDVNSSMDKPRLIDEESTVTIDIPITTDTKSADVSVITTQDSAVATSQDNISYNKMKLTMVLTGSPSDMIDIINYVTSKLNEGRGIMLEECTDK